ncbi:MAG TPA: GNAT family N-acetyltransferase, partial [Candidatus Limnocylindrales bacterium]
MTPRPPADIEGVSWRPITPDDAAAVHELVGAVERFDDLPFAATIEEIRAEMADPTGDLARDSMGGFAADGRLACYGHVRMRATATRRRMVNLDGHVHPEWRRRGLGGQVMAWSEERARQRLAESVTPETAGVPAFMEVWSDVRMADRRALFELRGYAPVRWYEDMRRPLDAALADVPLPAGLRLVGWSAADDDDYRRAHNEAFLDHWGSEPLTAAEWHHHFTGSPNFRPELTIGAHDGRRIVAYVIGYHSPADTAVTGRSEGWLGQVGTLREWRGKGAASALMVEAMRRMKAAGMTHAALDVDSD